MNHFEAGERVLLVDSRGRRYLITLKEEGSFHFHRGIVEHDAIIGQPEGSIAKATSGEALIAVRPTLADFVLKMKRGAQVVYPKDLAMMTMAGDIFPGARVLEAGAGSGALTIALLRAVGPEGHVYTYERRDEFADIALQNIEAFLGKIDNLTLHRADIYEGIEEGEVDRVVLDLPEPWRALGPVEESLTGGGVFVAYLPTVVQVQQLTDSLRGRGGWALVSTFETLIRTWNVKGSSVRPDHRMVAHTGFVTTARHAG